MPVTLALKSKYELRVTDNNGAPCLIPRSQYNSIFAQLFNYKTKIIAVDPAKYLAFPFVVKMGSSLIGLYSSSNSHASGSSQYIIRSDDNGLTWTQAIFYDAATNTTNPNLLSDLLSEGESVVLKVWTVKKTSGVLVATVQGTVSYAGITQALWSRAVAGPSGLLFRAGYGATGVGSDSKSALFQSSDGGVTWTGRATVFDVAGKAFNEFDLVNTSGTNWIAISREDLGNNNNMYYAVSTDDGLTWAAPVLIDYKLLNGRQPNVFKASDNSLVISAGDRFGSSGYDAAGTPMNVGFDTTGISIQRIAQESLITDALSAPTAGAALVRITKDSHGLITGDVIELSGAVGFAGIPATELNKFHTVTSISNNVLQIATTTVASGVVAAGGGSAIKTYAISKFGYRTPISPIYSTDGGQPMACETTAGRVCSVFYARKSVNTNPVISSTSLDIAPL